MQLIKHQQTTNNLLRLDAVTLKFGGLTALSNVSWMIPMNQQHPDYNVQGRTLYGVIGPNGAGKSTLFNLITGIYQPTFGKILFKDTQIQQLPTAEIVNFGIARTFQNIRLLPHLSVLDNLLVVTATERQGTFWESFFGTQPAKKISNDIMDRAQAALKLMGLSRVQKQLPTSLPYGEQRKLEIARTLMRKPRLLLLDEPAAGMNAVEKQELSEILKKIMTDNVTIIIIEHDMKFIMNICSHITVLNQGAICAEGTPSQIQNNPVVVETYLGKKHKII